MNTDLAAEKARRELLEAERESVYREARRIVSWAIREGLMKKPVIRHKKPEVTDAVGD